MSQETAPRDAQLAAMAHWHALSQEQQAATIRRLAKSGMTDYLIAAATKLAVEQVRRVLSKGTS